VNKQPVFNILLTLLVLGLATVIVQAAPGAQAVLNSPLPTPATFSSPLPVPIPCPSSVKQGSLAIEAKIEGLGAKDVAEIQLFPDTSLTAACLTTRGVVLPKLGVQNENRSITVANIPDGSYKLVVHAPSNYFREPQGYLFQVRQGQIVRSSDHPLRFKLIPSSDQDLPPCKDFVTQPDPPSSAPVASDVPFEQRRVVCRAERLIDISSPPKQPEPREGSVLGAGYHYAGPRTTQDNWGVWGRNYVVDAGVRHSAGPTQFVVERVYANDSTYAKWMEAGWAEHSSRDDRQYIYEFDSATNTWHYFDQYALSSGSAVETLVEYRPDVGTWWALYYLGGSSWALLAQESLGFTTADNGFNRGEVYTADGIHPVLPVSGFDTGYLKLTDGVWRLWDTRYATEVIPDPPYQCDVITQYYRFNIHSPVVFIPIVLNGQ
jgi:hypothetical protein